MADLSWQRADRPFVARPIACHLKSPRSAMAVLDKAKIINMIWYARTTRQLISEHHLYTVLHHSDYTPILSIPFTEIEYTLHQNWVYSFFLVALPNKIIGLTQFSVLLNMTKFVSNIYSLVSSTKKNVPNNIISYLYPCAFGHMTFWLLIFPTNHHLEERKNEHEHPNTGEVTP